MESRIDEHRRVDEVTEKVGEGLDRGALKAMSRDLASQESIGDLLRLQKVSAIAIDMLQVLDLTLASALRRYVTGSTV
jgi:hypothetical protein